ncbi:hypothetical protein [Heyndrickxia acidicola]|uniref:Uncharacterized protein n=1 Tax=Heyndrickxia acidicola TaxID=209389 RepID=A0ABU6MMP8_9BACI|nr:hypothetical protein [Heyndrickxia acidicola]MED1205951.1 hypothetical protein [Heyndrickxia acidicola]
MTRRLHNRPRKASACSGNQQTGQYACLEQKTDVDLHSTLIAVEGTRLLHRIADLKTPPCLGAANQYP